MVLPRCLWRAGVGLGERGRHLVLPGSGLRRHGLGLGTWYYLDASGAMRTGWLRDGSVWYYLRASGAMATGWVLDGGSWYYMDASGAMVTGARVIDGVSYVFDPSGRML